MIYSYAEARNAGKRCGVKHIEHDEQVQFFLYLRLLEGAGVEEAEMAFAVPNGLRVASIRVARRAVNEGMRAGVPDILVPVARGSKHGLAIEMKSPKGRSTAAQKEWQAKLRMRGWEVAECHSAIIALRTFIDYCKLEPAQYRILGDLLDERESEVPDRRQGATGRRGQSRNGGGRDNHEPR
jgi:hypothetical protein